MTLAAVRASLRSWRTASVVLLSFSSGLPLGLVWIAIPDWMAEAGFDNRVIGLITLAHAPWTFKMLWSPLMDRYVPPFWGRRRGWIAVAQVALFALTLALGGVGADPDAPFVLLALATAIAFASASQDIAIDAYAVEVLRPDERGIAVGARVALYRFAMTGVSSVAITLTAMTSWRVAAWMMAACYLPLLWVTARAPEPDVEYPPPQSLRESVWLPFLASLSRPRALEILAFVFFYKLADQLAQSLQRPFLEDMGYSVVDRGVGLATVGLWGTLGGTFLGGALTPVLGLGRCLWIFGFLQIASNVGYILISRAPVDPLLFYSAMTFETLATGLGMGAFGVLLLAITQKRFSATQYALFSSLFALPRLIAGPVAGFFSHAAGWTSFFWFTMAAGVPGMVLLARFAPWSVRDPSFDAEEVSRTPGVGGGRLVAWGVAGGAVALVLAGGAASLLPPAETPWLRVVACATFATVVGIATAAFVAARPGGGDR